MFQVSLVFGYSYLRVFGNPLMKIYVGWCGYICIEFMWFMLYLHSVQSVLSLVV